MDALCAIDIDTIVPVLMASKKKKLPRVYDAHEYFTEMTEIKRRPLIFRIWDSVERYCVPKFPFGYTVSQSITDTFLEKYNVSYDTVRNTPYFTEPENVTSQSPEIAEILKKIGDTEHGQLPIILYQGAVNEGRGMIQLINTMPQVNARLVIAGTGNMMEQTKTHVANTQQTDKIFLLGNLTPKVLKQFTTFARMGINLVENTGLSQYYSLANKYFDYIMAHKPQVSMNYPEYKAINDEFNIALLVDGLGETELAAAMNKLLKDDVLYNQLKMNCAKAAASLCWEKEEQKLLALWNQLLPITHTGE